MNQGGTWQWYWNRLRQMSPAEVVHRLRRAVQAHFESWGLGTAARPPVTEATAVRWLPRPPAVSIECYRDAADRILKGELLILGLGQHPYGLPPNWNRDPKTGIVAPDGFAKGIDYRNVRVVGDIKYLWEPNRHQHLPTLAQAFCLTGEWRYADAVRQSLESWWDQCPYLHGPNWTSALELAIRLINWSLTWQLLDSRPEWHDRPEVAGFEKRWLTSIFQHQHAIARSFSAYSSANNHRIGEAAGLFIAAVTWPHWRQSDRWRRRGRRILLEEIERQHTGDGVNREQATGYIPFVLEFLVVAGVAAERTGDPFPASCWRKVESVLEFAAAITDSGGAVPCLGDGDDGCVTRLEPETGADPWNSVLALTAAVVNRGDLAPIPPDDRARWLGVEVARTGVSRPAAPPRRCFPEGGYYVLGQEFGTDREIRILADVGPLGYGRLAAHGHADALSFTLALGGVQFLIDPGTYTYYLEPTFRSYFRSTVAHNTVTVDGLDQSTMGGPFIWLTKARSHCEVVEFSAERDLLVGSHDGFQRLRDPVLHRRTWDLAKPVRRLDITDELHCEGSHHVTVHWHFAPGCDVRALDDGVSARHRGHELVLRTTTTLPDGLELVVGRRTPPLGWNSPAFGVLEPSPTVAVRYAVAGRTTIQTRFLFSDDEARGTSVQ